jgi:hypothetical protein
LVTLLAPLSTGCAISASILLGPRSVRVEETRPDDPRARLHCAGVPCQTARVVTRTEQASVVAFLLAAAAEGSCWALATRNYHAHGGTGAEVLSDACGTLLLWDLLTVPLAIPLEGMFFEHRSTGFEPRVELELGGRRSPLAAHFVQEDGRVPAVFSVQAVLQRQRDSIVDVRALFCVTRHWRSPTIELGPPPSAGAVELWDRVAALLAGDFGTDSRYPPKQLWLLSGTLQPESSGLRLELVLKQTTTGAEIWRQSAWAPSAGQLPLRSLLDGLYGVCP